MKYTGMPMGMWLLFSRSFRKQLEEVLGYSREEARKITVNAQRQYRMLIGKLPEFEKKDRFKMNIVSCVMLRLIRCGTCGNGDRCDYLVVGNENPMVKEYETVTDEGGFLVSRRTENNYIAEGENG